MSVFATINIQTKEKNTERGTTFIVVIVSQRDTTK